MPAAKLAMYKEQKDPVLTTRPLLAKILGEDGVKALEAAAEVEMEEAVAICARQRGARA